MTTIESPLNMMDDGMAQQTEGAANSYAELRASREAPARPQKEPQAGASAPNLPPEVWMPVHGWDGYEVSDLGRVRSWRKRGGGRRRLPAIRRFGCADGYATVQLSNEGFTRSCLVHRLVLQAFKPLIIRAVRHASHLNGDRTDNRLVNLRWVTRAENERHKRAHGTDPRGERNGSAKVTPDIVRAIRERYKARSETFEAMGAEYGISGRQVAKIARREAWAHVA